MAAKTTQSDSQLLERRALQVQRGAARAAVLGVNDGLVSVLCIVVTVAAAGATTHSVILAGFAGLLAGAVSMAAGEWISVRSQVELFEGVLSDLSRLASADRGPLHDNLIKSFQAAGYSNPTASTVAQELHDGDIRNLELAYATHVLGMNPDELGSPWRAAFSSFALFTLGALAPLLPWFFASGAVATSLAIIFTIIGGLLVGGYVSYTSGKPIFLGALRQMLIIIFAAIVTYGVGHLFGVITG